MDDALHAALDAFRQRFQALATEMRQTHAAWQEAVRTHDRTRQSALIAREQALVTDVTAVLADWQAILYQRRL